VLYRVYGEFGREKTQVVQQPSTVSRFGQFDYEPSRHVNADITHDFWTSRKSHVADDPHTKPSLIDHQCPIRIGIHTSDDLAECCYMTGC
jgi:hypothetical protein